MKLLDKLKNALFEEEYVEVNEPKKEKKKVKERLKEPKKELVKEPPIVKKIELPEREQKESKHQEEDLLDSLKDDDVRDSDLLKGDPNFKFQVILEDDFASDDKKREDKAYTGGSAYGQKEDQASEKPLYAQGSYNNSNKQDYSFHDHNPYEKKERKPFMPSLVISPIYGILDYNYKKEEIVTRRDVSYSSYG
ncbi:MAG: hypothetical protein RSD40_04185, partial [Bacilli bacterium]